MEHGGKSGDEEEKEDEEKEDEEKEEDEETVVSPPHGARPKLIGVPILK
jgi:hypothetical protein|tara:strand:+ start:665 stop:811 length:147 start_codon:yes stop_codon:yes gene_type:complete